jgi:hypothetical protein
MNTKTKQKNQGLTTRKEHGPKKQQARPTIHHDHEHPETRLTR